MKNKKQIKHTIDSSYFSFVKVIKRLFNRMIWEKTNCDLCGQLKDCQEILSEETFMEFEWHCKECQQAKKILSIKLKEVDKKEKEQRQQQWLLAREELLYGDKKE